MKPKIYITLNNDRYLLNLSGPHNVVSNNIDFYIKMSLPDIKKYFPKEYKIIATKLKKDYNKKVLQMQKSSTEYLNTAKNLQKKISQL